MQERRGAERARRQRQHIRTDVSLITGRVSSRLLSPHFSRSLIPSRARSSRRPALIDPGRWTGQSNCRVSTCEKAFDFGILTYFIIFARAGARAFSRPERARNFLSAAGIYRLTRPRATDLLLECAAPLPLPLCPRARYCLIV